MTPLYTSPDYKNRLALITVLLEAARDITQPLYRASLHVENKSTRSGDFDPVTAADRDAEAVLREIIIKAFPDDAIEGEEFDDRSGPSGWLWTLDPIDGTRAFIAAVPVWSTLISVSWQGEPVIGVADFPAMSETYYGAGGASWRETDHGREDLSCRACAKLTDAVLACTEPHGMFGPGEMAAWKIIHRTARFARLGLDSYGYCLLAAGYIDLVIEADLKPCDVRALIPIVEGAGGHISSWRKGTAINGGPVVAMGDAALDHETMMVLGRAL